MKVILQNLLFPKVGLCTDENMYFRRKLKRTRYYLSNELITLNANESVSFDTYFNSFSVAKWNKYTNVNEVSLGLDIMGEFEIRLFHATILDNEIDKNLVYIHKIKADERESVSISFPCFDNAGIYYFEIEAKCDNCYFYGGNYYTDIENDGNDVHLAIDICTFNREGYIRKNLESLKFNFLENTKSTLYGNLDVFIIDNGRNLSITENLDIGLHIIKNKNAGGAGGFTRGIMEVLQLKEKLGFTHILMMDDDVTLCPESLFRTFMFLKYIKAEYKDSFLGGSMLRLDERYIQHEIGGYRKGDIFFSNNKSFNLTSLIDVVKNECDLKINFFAWWYCVMPLDTINLNNLPLPIFIRWDDCEYGLRNGKDFISLNGICLWHEPFENKTSSFLNYYTWRNLCIINSIHDEKYGKSQIKKEMKKRLSYFLKRYEYKNIELCFRGINDFLDGIDKFKEIEPESLHQEICNLGYKLSPVEELNMNFVHGAYEVAKIPKKLSKKEKIIQKLTFNGFLLPSKRTALVPANYCDFSHLYRAANIIHYEEASNRAYKTRKNVKEFTKSLIAYIRLCNRINRRYEDAKHEFRTRYSELTNENYWNSYLNKPAKKVELQYEGELVNAWNRRLCIKQYINLVSSYIVRGIQHILFWFPVKKNKISMYVHNRSGYTCNPKYICEFLINNYSDKTQINWITQYPDSCDEIRQKGIKVVKANTFSHLKEHFTSKVIISNDNLNFKLVKRRKQLYINTWHGGMNYKKIGYDSFKFERKIQLIDFKKKNCKPDIFVSGSEFFSVNTANSFGFEEKIFVPSGLPRNDIIINNHEEVSKTVKEKLNIPTDSKVLIYAPTFRKGCKAESYNLNFRKLVQTLEAKFGGEWYVLFRTHTFVKQRCPIHYDRVIDVSDYDDMQELICTSDMMISDYSSCMWDFSLTGRPCISYAVDMLQYQNQDRSFAYSPELWPYPIVKNNNELISCIENFDEIEYKENLKKHHKNVGSYENGQASETICKYILEYCGVIRV